MAEKSWNKICNVSLVRNVTERSKIPRVNEFVDVLIGGEHSLILPLRLVLLCHGTVPMEVLAAHPFLPVLRRLHVAEEAQDVGVVGARLAQLVELARQLRRDQVRVGREARWTPGVKNIFYYNFALN